MKKKMTDMHDVLFEQLETIRNRELKGDVLFEEIRRSDAMCKIATQLISNAHLHLDAQKALTDGTADKTQLPMLVG